MKLLLYCIILHGIVVRRCNKLLFVCLNFTQEILLGNSNLNLPTLIGWFQDEPPPLPFSSPPPMMPLDEDAKVTNQKWDNLLCWCYCNDDVYWFNCLDIKLKQDQSGSIWFILEVFLKLFVFTYMCRPFSYPSLTEFWEMIMLFRLLLHFLLCYKCFFRLVHCIWSYW